MKDKLNEGAELTDDELEQVAGGNHRPIPKRRVCPYCNETHNFPAEEWGDGQIVVQEGSRKGQTVNVTWYFCNKFGGRFFEDGDHIYYDYNHIEIKLW